MSERDAFEKWARDNCNLDLERDPDGDWYRWLDTTLRWKAWLAATTAERERAAMVAEQSSITWVCPITEEDLVEHTLDTIAAAIRAGGEWTCGNAGGHV